MPKMPPWAEGARIVYDNEYSLAYIRRGRREPWHPYLWTDGNLIQITNVDPRSNLDKTRENVLTAIGESIGNMVMSLHPHADKKHMVLTGSYIDNKYVPTHHACGIDYAVFKGTTLLEGVTCPVCIAVMIEDMADRMKQIGPKAVAEARQHVRDVRTFNALGHVVDGESATDDL